MDPSSLVFLAIIGVWAAYLVPTWLRRRVQLAQSRTRDRFSAGVRVLNRRRTARPAGASHRSGGAVLTPPRPVVPAAAPVSSAPVSSAPVSSAPGVSGTAARPSVPVGEADRARARVAQREAHLAHLTAVDSARVAASRRARVMLALVVLTAAAWAVTLTTTVPLWGAAPVTAVLLLNAVAGRMAAVRSHRSLAASGRRLEVARRRLEAAVAAAPSAAGAVASAPAEVAPESGHERPVAVGGETWVPVPVPPPTYTLKPAVHRPEPAPLTVSPAAVSSAPSPAAVYDDRIASAADVAERVRAAGARAALPRRAEEVERILDLDALEQRTAVNG